MKQPDNIMAMVISAGQCDWGNCMYCGWGKLEFDKDIDRLKKDFERKIAHKKPQVDTLKLFTSGSFIDDNQFPPEYQSYVLDRCEEVGIKHIITESLPKFMTEEKLEFIKRPNVKFTMCFGLEVSNDQDRLKIGKAFTFKDFTDKCELLRKHGHGVRVFLMVNPPNIDNMQKSIDDSVRDVYPYADSMVLINTFPHVKSHLFNMWASGKWSPLNPKQFYEVVGKYEGDPKIELDDSNFAFMPKFPPEKQEPIVGATEKELIHPYYIVWQDYINRFYHPPKGKDIALFLPCSFRKPYSASQTHKSITSVLQNTNMWSRVHRIVVSTPGIIPFEFAGFYPFNNYDWPEWEETPEVKKKLVQVGYERAKAFLENHRNDYSQFFVYMKHDSELYQGLKKAAKELGINLVDVVSSETYEKIKDEKNPVTSSDALNELKHAMGGERPKQETVKKKQTELNLL